MKMQCDWCGSWIEDNNEVCPNCGGVNKHYNRHAAGVPQTIEELKEWAKVMNLPLQEMRTFIGEDYKGAKAFGIYKDESDGTFVVYKNKADGTRAVRYKGTDEAYAVNELYQKMKERIAIQKSHFGNNKNSELDTKAKRKRTNLIAFFIFPIIVCLIIPAILSFESSTMPKRGYYNHYNTEYYYFNNDWYRWDNNSWTTTTKEPWMENDYDSYYDSEGYMPYSDYGKFSDSEYYNEYYSDSANWDDDSHWDSNDSWDSSFDDWDSDW